MSGFDDRRNDPTVLGQPRATHPYQQESSGAESSDPDGSATQSAESASQRPWKRDSGFHQQVAWPGVGESTPQQWGASAGAATPDPTLQWQPSGGSAIPDPTLQWQPSAQAPGAAGGQAPGTVGGQAPGTAGGLGGQPSGPVGGQTPGTVGGQAPRAVGGHAQTPGVPPGQAPPGGQAPAPNYQWQPAPTAQWQQPGGQAPQWQAPAQADPTLLAQPRPTVGDPAALWQPSLGTPEPNQPGNAAPTLLGYPNATRLGQPDPAAQWQQAPGQHYGEVPPLEQTPTYAAPQYGQPYGQAPGYAQQGAYGVPPQQLPQGGTPPSGGRGKALLLIGLVVLLVAGGAVTAVLLTNRGSDNSDSQRNSPSMVSALTPSASAAPTPSKTTSAAPPTNANGRNETPTIPGYQVVVAPDRGAAYDVPASWTVAPETVIGGFGEPPNAVAGKGYASEGKGYCPGSTRTSSFLTGSKDSNTGAAATDLGTKTAQLAYLASTDGHPSAPVPLNSLDGSQHGMFVETKGTVPQAKPGCATTYSVYTVAYPTDNGSFVMVITADTGVPNAVDAETAKRIFTSIRPHDN